VQLFGREDRDPFDVDDIELVIDGHLFVDDAD
jgi:hypothetical protein